MRRKTYSAPSVRKAFKILEIISGSSNGFGISEIAKQLKIGKSTVHGIAAALEEMGLLVRDPLHKKYQIGYSLLELSRKFYRKTELRDIARVPMEKLMERVEETVFLGIMNGDHVTILDVVESHNEMKITSPPGTRLSLLAGALGKVFLGQFDKEKAKGILREMGLKKYTSKSIGDAKKYFKEVEDAKKKGCAVDDEEYLPGVRAVAAPLQAVSLPPAAIWVVGFTSSFTDQKMEEVILEIRKTAQDINRSLEDHGRP
jgi:DNA-binding IclR family transcriptional regulator